MSEGPSLLVEIITAMTAVTPEQIERTRTTLTALEPDEVLIAVIEDDESRRLVTLSREYDRQYDLVAHAARYDAHNKEERDQLVKQANRLRSLEQIARELSWRRMEDVTGSPLLDRGRTFGIRENFSLVSSVDDSGPYVQQIPLPPDLVRSLVDSMRRRGKTEEPEGEKGKPQ